MGSGGGCGPGDAAQRSVYEWREKYRKAGSPDFGYNCMNDFEAWLICRIEELEFERDRLKEAFTAFVEKGGFHADTCDVHEGDLMGRGCTCGFEECVRAAAALADAQYRGQS